MRNLKQLDKWQPSQNRLIGWISSIAGLSLLFISIIPAMIANTEIEYDYLYIITSLSLFAFGGAMIIYGKRNLTKQAEQVLAKDKRAPIVYLRSFGGEADAFSFNSYFKAVGLQFTSRGTGLSISPWDPTLQAQIALVMDRIGPYIAVGRPGAKLPGTGAARLYIPDNQWKDRVIELLHEAKLVIVRAGTSEGLKWEIGMVMSHVSPQQLLVILPIAKYDYHIFRKIISEQGIRLPETIPKSLLMTFEKDWTPKYLPIIGKLENTLAPYFKANGIEPPKTNWLDAFRMLF